jgi:hypothetical protein
MDKQSGSFFWYSVLDGSTRWVTHNEAIKTESLKNYGTNEENEISTGQTSTVPAVHYLPIADTDFFSDETEVKAVAVEPIQYLSPQQKVDGEKALTNWLTASAKITSSELVSSYVAKLIEANIGSVDTIAKKQEKDSNFLQVLGFAHGDVARVQQALIKEKLQKLNSASSANVLASVNGKVESSTPGAETGATIDEKDLCLICMENRKCMVFFPCGHLCVCETCDNLMNRKQGVLCIMCRVEIVNRAKLFVA